MSQMHRELFEKVRNNDATAWPGSKIADGDVL